jgi:hypothetical protein
MDRRMSSRFTGDEARPAAFSLSSGDIRRPGSRSKASFDGA